MVELPPSHGASGRYLWRLIQLTAACLVDAGVGVMAISDYQAARWLRRADWMGVDGAEFDLYARNASRQRESRDPVEIAQYGAGPNESPHIRCFSKVW